MDKERVCCICNQNKKFLARINTVKKLYCMQCEAKITREYGLDYWKPCSFEKFFVSMSESIGKKRKGRKSNMFSSMKETLREINESESSKENKR